MSTRSTAGEAATVAEDLTVVVGRLVRRMRASATMAPHQFSTLRTIERDGDLTASQLAASERVRPQTMAHTLGQLAEAGLVTARVDPHDGRKTLIGLSDEGREAIEVRRGEVNRWLASAIDEQLDDAERRTLADAAALLARLVEA